MGRSSEWITPFFNHKWPEWDEKALVRDETEIAVQLNGRVRDKILLPSGLGKEETEEAAMKDDKVKALIEGRTVVKVIGGPRQAGQYSSEISEKTCMKKPV